MSTFLAFVARLALLLPLIGLKVLGVRPATGPVKTASSNLVKARMATMANLGGSTAGNQQNYAEIRAGDCNSYAVAKLLNSIATSHPPTTTIRPHVDTTGVDDTDRNEAESVAEDLGANDDGVVANLVDKLRNEMNEESLLEAVSQRRNTSAALLGVSSALDSQQLRVKVDNVTYNENYPSNVIRMSFQGPELANSLIGGRVANEATICFSSEGAFLNIGHYPLRITSSLRNNFTVEDVQKDFLATPEKEAEYSVKLEGHGDATYKIKMTDKFIASKDKSGNVKVDIAMVDLLKDEHGNHHLPGYLNVPGGLQVFIGDFPIGCLKNIDGGEDQPELTVSRDSSPFIPTVTEVTLADQHGHARPFRMLNVPQDEGIILANELVKVLSLSSDIIIAQCVWDSE